MESRWERTWPELFDGLEHEVRSIVVASLANSALEGAEPSRDDIVDMIEYATGQITAAEYHRRTISGLQEPDRLP